MSTTPWAFPAFQGHTKAPLIGNHSSPANRQLHSTRPDNHSQLGAIHPRAIVRYQHISSANTHMKAHWSTLQYQHKLTGASMHTLWILRRGGCCCKRTATEEQQAERRILFFLWLILNSISYFFSLLDKHLSYLHFCRLDLLRCSRPL